jgi:phosphoribosylamine--glycine ligase
MKVLVIGGGGREHALAWRCIQSTSVDSVLVAPGNAGTALEPGVENIPVAAEDIEGLLNIARERGVDLTIVGPEAPLVSGIVDRFSAANLKCFGPTAAGARLEGSKSFTKDFLARHSIPTAAYKSFTSVDPALAYIREVGAPLVVKADGLAAGKGVIVAHSIEEAEQAARSMLSEGEFGEAGAMIVVEEFLYGEEASFIAMVDGGHILPLATSQDHKARDNGDKGPNTGGMGAYSPAPVVTEALHKRIMDDVMRPTVDGLASEGTPYTGFLYAGLMIGRDGVPKVLEFNCRFGDPETQPIMMRLRSDLPELCLAAINGNLDQHLAEWDPRPALGIVLAAKGYPGDYPQGDPISGLDQFDGSADMKVFHAGTRLDNGNVVTAGGRVLCAVALGDNIIEAQTRAYSVASSIDWDGRFYRDDIGYRAVARERDTANA